MKHKIKFGVNFQNNATELSSTKSDRSSQHLFVIAQSAGDVEYTNCTSAEG